MVTLSDVLEKISGSTIDASTALNYLRLDNASYSIGFSFE